MRVVPPSVLWGMFLTHTSDDETATAHRAATAQFGFLPNWAVALGARPAVLAAWNQLARDAAAVTAADVQELRDVGLSDDDVLDVALAVAARCFFATALDAVGVQADPELADALGPQLSALLTVGRPVA
jgi:alkylhydroperoxidase family enzyme